MWKARFSAKDFLAAKPLAIGALTANLGLWFFAFLTVGGEWFVMWQSQTWNGTDLVSYTITGTSGWSFSSTTQPTTFDYVDFATDSSGAVTTAANWSISPGGPITTSWAGSATGVYDNTGSNFIGYESGFSYWLSVNNVAQNQVGSSWTATAAAVPEIDLASFGSALSLVLGALGLAERKRRVVIG
jgi:hypothetical protein